MQQSCRVLASTGLVLLLALAASGAPVELLGTLQNRKGDPVSGTITVIENGPPLVLSHYQVDETGKFRIRGDAARGLVLHARAPDHASEEKLVSPGTSGTFALHFVLPIGQSVEGRVVDANGKGVPGASVRVRYHEPSKPVRSVASDAEEITDGAGRFKFHNVGADVLFVVDVHASNYIAATSPQFKIDEGESLPLEDIVLGRSGATVVASLLDKDDDPMRGVEVTLVADPAGLSAEAHGSWLHHRSFRQQKSTSSLGNVRFSGVPPGRIIVRAKAPSGAIEERTSVVEKQDLRLLLRAP